MSKKTCKDCMHCTVDDDEVLCVDMPWHYPFGGEDRTTLDKEACEHFLERDKPTLFDLVTKSPETLAEASVYQNYIGLWCSPFIQWGKDTRAEAITATIEKLKGFANG